MPHKFMLFWAILFTSVHIKSVLSYLNQEELKIVVDVIEKLEIRHCIFLQNEGENRVHEFWKNMASKVFVTVFNKERTLAYYIDDKYQHLSSHKAMVIINDEHSLITKELLKFNKRYDFHMDAVKWLVFSQNIMSISIDITKVINYNCQFIIVQRTNSTIYQLTEMYGVKNQAFSHLFGLWSQGLKKVYDDSFYSKRSNLNGTELTTFVPELCLSETKFDPRVCNIMEVLSDFSRSLNFQIDQDITSEESIFDEFLFSFDDILGGGHYWVESNDLAIHLGPLYETTYNWYIKYPDGKLKSDYYLGPFETDFWSAIILSIIFQTVSIIVIKYFLKRFGNLEERNILVNNICVGIETFCNQSGSNEPENVAFRIIDLSLRFIAIFSIGSYGAVITSFLALKLTKIPFSNLNEFFELNEYRLLMDNVSSDLIKDPWDLESKEFLDLDKLITNYSILLNFVNLTEIELNQYLERICEEKLAIAFFDNDLYKFNSNPPCDLYKVDVPLAKSSIYLVLSLLSPFQRLFSEKLLRLRESGVFKRMQKQIYETHTWRDPYLDSDFYPVEMEQMIEVLSVPLIGIAISTLILVCELMHNKWMI